ncbi:hypothetical protein [Pontiella sulfatireligans]|uniref:PEP-CTERM protein-sorting domain-containing protein n=1 Tax=Pontiella sulfatireligans TaxID=2750658 RepID=A0A6C2UTX9_9BACT|nr:hypothetical protein [Pontiella sulfatireligans]VGO22667.1 hypothetical protein SCARR_04762 [Pontiella sulfatireligans]
MRKTLIMTTAMSLAVCMSASAGVITVVHDAIGGANTSPAITGDYTVGGANAAHNLPGNSLLAYNGANPTAITYTLTGVDLTAEGGTANETIEFVLSLSAVDTSDGGRAVSIWSADANNNSLNVADTTTPGSTDQNDIVGGEVLGASVAFGGGTTFDTAKLDLDITVANLSVFRDDTASFIYEGGTNTQTTTRDFSLSGTSFDLVADSGGFRLANLDYEITVIPEPATLGLIGAFGVSVLFIRRRLSM